MRLLPNGDSAGGTGGNIFQSVETLQKAAMLQPPGFRAGPAAKWCPGQDSNLWPSD
jgi:hypothetical protein